MKVDYRNYKCRNCGHVQLIQTNHQIECFDYCKNCSWKPSFGKYAIPFNGRTYRPFDFVSEVSKMERFPNTKKALEIYDKEEPTIRELFNLAMTDAEVESAARVEKASLVRVQTAFYQDTKELNRRIDCELASISFMRRMVETDGKE